MSNGVNSVHLIGNLGKDPEVRYTQGGTAVCNFSIAIGSRKKDGDNWVDHTEWVDIVTWGKTAENVGKFMAKGKQVFIDGRIQTRKWEDKEGNNRYSTEVVGERVNFLGSKGDDIGGGQKQPDGVKPNGDGFADDDLPF